MKIMKIFYNEKNLKELKKVILGKLNNIEINFLKNLKLLVIDQEHHLN